MVNVLKIARVCHEVNRAYCQGLGDGSQPSWDTAPRWQIESVIEGVKFHLQNPLASPSASHEKWLAHKEAEGWRYGLIKDEDAKTHPCMVPFHELPVEQRAKDYLFRAVVHSVAEAFE